MAEDQINHSMDTRRVTKQQEKALTESSAFMVGFARPVIQYQIAMTRLWADTLASFASQYERTAEMMSSFAQQAQHNIDKR